MNINITAIKHSITKLGSFLLFCCLFLTAPQGYAQSKLE